MRYDGLFARSKPPAWLVAVAIVAQYGDLWLLVQTAAAAGAQLHISTVEIALAFATAVLAATVVAYLRVRRDEPAVWTYVRWTIFAYLQTMVGAIVEYRVRGDADAFIAWLLLAPLLGGGIAFNIRFWRARWN